MGSRIHVVKVIWGSNKEKPVASRQLAELLTAEQDLSGYLYIGYPIIGAPTGPMKFDALLLSEQCGIVAFDLIEGGDLGDYEARQDDIASMLEVKLKPYDALKQRRNLKFPINTVTFAPAKLAGLPASDGDYNLANNTNAIETVRGFEWTSDLDTYKSLLAAIQVVTNIRAGKQKRTIENNDSLGARLKKLEESIATLDQHQSEAVIETVEGVQRIRGLAGSGKTIVIALKVAYLHAQNPDWRIAVTFHTRALKEQFKRLINNFTIEQIGTEPDWDKIDIVNSWGGAGSKENNGIYHMFCVENDVEYYDYGSAKNMYGTNHAFQAVCKKAIEESAHNRSQRYDVILVDEAQDFPPDFLRLCFAFLKEPKRLVYAYDELQSLNGLSVLPPDELFGKDSEGKPLVTLQNDDPTQPKQDIVLEKCYRNSRPLLATAHSLGFGLNREKGLVQFFQNDALWEDVGYSLQSGSLVGGQNVELCRTQDSSPLFLEEHTPIGELIKFEQFDSKDAMDQCLAEQIFHNITRDELKPEDIVVINPNPLTTQEKVGAIRKQLMQMGIRSEIAGVTTSRDKFASSGCVTFTGIFRAKGNEAGMVYIMNANECFESGDNNYLSLIRNRLFTAITRSKAWVRLYGIGPNMAGLIEEWQTLANNNFSLKFRYPTAEEKARLRLVNRDMTVQERTKQIKYSRYLQELQDAMNSGQLDLDLVPEELRDVIQKYK